MARTIDAGEKGQSTQAISGATEGRFAIGPPKSGALQHRGIYIRQVAGANGTWRWVEDQPTPGTASPTTYSFLADPAS